MVITANSIYIIYQMKSLQQVHDSFPCSGCLLNGRNQPEPCSRSGGEHLTALLKHWALHRGCIVPKQCLLDTHPASGCTCGCVAHINLHRYQAGAAVGSALEELGWEHPRLGNSHPLQLCTQL